MNSASPRDVRKARQKERLTDERDQKDLRDVLSTIQGRRFVWKQLTAAGCFRLDWEANNHGFNDFSAGRRSMGNALMAEIMALDPEMYVRMAREANSAYEKEPEPVEPTEPEPEELDHA